jgi:hypothetical protein
MSTTDVKQHNEERFMKSLFPQTATFDAVHEVGDSIDEGQYFGSAFIYVGKWHGATMPKSARRAEILRLLRIEARLPLGAMASRRGSDRTLTGRSLQVLPGSEIVGPDGDAHELLPLAWIHSNRQHLDSENVMEQS